MDVKVKLKVVYITLYLVLAALVFAYSEWGRHLADKIITYYVDLNTCSEEQTEICLSAITSFQIAEDFLYIVYSFLICLPVYFLLTVCLLNKECLVFRSLMLQALSVFVLPWAVLYSLGEISLINMVAHGLMVFIGFSCAVFFLSKKRT